MTRNLTINGRLIGDDEPAYLIAEIGHNHAHDMEKLEQMVDSALEAGADAVKFQTRNPKEVYAPNDRRGAYFFESDNPQWMDRVYGRHREKLEWSRDEWEHVFAYCARVGITAFSTPFDFTSLDLLASFDVPAYKIASGDATNLPLIRAAASHGKPLIISTGGCSIEEVDEIVETMEQAGGDFALLQCSCIYPAPNDVLNLRVISQYRDRYGGVVAGLSTHNYEWTPTLAAYTLGGRIFEHHYTNDREWKGTDNHFSLTPNSLRSLREACDTVREALGQPDKRMDSREHEPTIERRKSLYWKRQVFEYGEITEDDIGIMCPGEGLPPKAIDLFIGRHVAHTTGVGELVDYHDLMLEVAEEPEFNEKAEALGLS